MVFFIAYYNFIIPVLDYIEDQLFNYMWNTSPYYKIFGKIFFNLKVTNMRKNTTSNEILRVRIKVAQRRAETNKLKKELWRIKHPHMDHLISHFFKNKRNNTSKKVLIDTFTKLWINILMIFSCLWISMSYVLILKGFGNYAESLSQTICLTIIGAFIPYLIKSFFETYYEKKSNLNIDKIKSNITQSLDSINYSDSSSDKNNSVG